MQEALKTSEFALPFSYYQMGGETTTRLTRPAWPELSGIWAKVRVGKEPHWETALALGKRLAVDAAVMYAMDPDVGTDYMWVYFLDIANGQKTVVPASTYYYELEAIEALTKITRNLLTQYHHRRERSTAQ
ncbi:MAG: hypothetical protein ETSY2_04580 [Candidatus Entotheonella gemina]|uniref:Uncharacterized protein n=1 Tax=Candidatus Entotheonella gemina TaxID=1429439 RepID=W4MFW7_9BACT|nr:MAG: hypothetical protein ETSY2_04580 [Candidatus Entotheonella gemina]